MTVKRRERKSKLFILRSLIPEITGWKIAAAISLGNLFCSAPREQEEIVFDSTCTFPTISAQTVRLFTVLSLRSKR
jgi:hypothetical protein